MALGDKRYTRIPPESTGDRVYMIHTAEIEYKTFNSVAGGSTDHNWQIGQMYMIAGFGGTGMMHVHGVYDKGDGTGILAVHYNKAAKYENLEPTVDANISYNGTPVAQVAAFYDVYIPAQNIMGYDNPEYGMDVDITGSANIRFAEGLPQLDAWGKLRTSGATHIGDYVFGQKEILDNNFSPTQLNGGSVTYDNDRNSVTIKVPGATDPEHVTNEGFASCSSNLYHHYVAGSSHLYMGTARLNNTGGPSGCVRNWGMFDANNGFMFRLDQNNNLSVVIRSSTTGSRVDNVIARSTWNGDKVDGSGDSQATLDLSKDNIYWIDVQWHGAGRVRFGTYINGARVVMHSYYHGNNYEVSMSQTASLPTCWSVKAVTGPTDDTVIETWSASVWTETTLDLNEKGTPATYATPHATVTANISDDWQYLFSISPKVELPNGEVNHTLYMPTSVTAYALDAGFDGGIATTGKGLSLDAVIDLKAEINSVATGFDFSAVPGTSVEVDSSATSYENGKVLLQEMFAGRYETETTDTFNNWQYGAVKNFADDGGTVVNNIQTVSNASPAVITVASGERVEVRDPIAAGVAEFPFNIAEYASDVDKNQQYEVYDAPAGWESFGGVYYYVKPIAANQFEVYNDYDRTTDTFSNPVDTSGLPAWPGGSSYIKGFRGSRIIWSFYAKTRTALHNNVKLMVTVNWKEIIQ